MNHDDDRWPDDPRTNPETIRSVSGTGDTGRVTLVGVVHDHPASAHRVRAAVAAADPAVVALELPPLSLPLFRRYAAADRVPPEHGGEMSAAIQAAGDRRVVGIDLPRSGATTTLWRRLRETWPSVRTAAGVVRTLATVSLHAAWCRVAAGWGRLSGTSPAVDEPVSHDCSRSDPPGEQAADEARIRAAESALLGAVEAPHVTALDDAREAAMAAALTAHRAVGPVVAVVGFGHLDAVADRLRADGAR